MAPNWLGSPQHFVAGAALSLVVGLLARRRFGLGSLWSLAVAIMATMAAEAIVELVEYPLLYADGVSRTAYYDTIGDIGLTLVGALAGAVAAVLVARHR
jgi:hypothetical protein